MSNLIRNALQYAEAAGFMRVRATDSWIEVEDDGQGISNDQRAAIFSPFVSGPAGTSDNLGLGLSLVQRICQHQGWRVELNCPSGRGCRFWVLLADEVDI